jgi:hypothetical protein
MRTPVCLLLLAAGLLPAAHAAPYTAEPGCRLPDHIDGRRFTNRSDPTWRPDNPNAGRMVRVDFSGNRYLLSVLGTRLRFHGSYAYRRMADNIAVIDMHEAFEAGDSHYQLLLSCRTDLQGRFVFTQFDGPIEPRRRQNSGTWTLQPR